MFERGFQCAAIAVTLALVSACTPTTYSENPGAPEDALCGADRLDGFVNMMPTDRTKAEIAATVGPRPTRYVGPNDVITLDHNPERLNAELGEDGRIKRFRCG